MVNELLDLSADFGGEDLFRKREFEWIENTSCLSAFLAQGKLGQLSIHDLRQKNCCGVIAEAAMNHEHTFYTQLSRLPR
ncbi:MAG: hypothetical protein J1E42_05610 [Akkermansiaceae bacterium]|nr:hypothetical protein [Akkermansiaceae bacterium]